MIAALFVATGGVYFGLPDVDPWDEARDARGYAGPHPVVAHPPCERWGRYWHGGPSVKVRRVKGDDGGCFASALAAVRRWGGVLEHPEASQGHAGNVSRCAAQHREIGGAVVKVCERCGGRGWVPPPAGGDWALQCPRCRGAARELTLCGLARVIDEDRNSLYRLRDMRVRPATAARIFDKLVAWWAL